jgi:hypothetical protein
VRLSPLGTPATNWPIVPDPDDTWVGSIWGNKKITRRKPAPAPLCPLQIPHVLIWNRNLFAAVSRRRLAAASAMARTPWMKRWQEISNGTSGFRFKTQAFQFPVKPYWYIQIVFWTFYASVTTANGFARKRARTEAARRQYIRAYCEQTYTHYWHKGHTILRQTTCWCEPGQRLHHELDGVRFPAEEKIISSTGWGQPGLLYNGNRALFPRGLSVGRDNHSSQFSTEIKNGGAIPPLLHICSWRGA